uniref:AIG1-type G domain-containing protein n=2 Tax=Gasterosteus aculeatus aculeatus TaxID=481459 RepID=A0AAQ4P1Z5_GASAC
MPRAAVGAAADAMPGAAVGAAADAMPRAMPRAAVGAAADAMPGAVVGAAVGALAGAVVGTAADALAGAAVGTAADEMPGAAVGAAVGTAADAMPRAAVGAAAGALAGAAVGAAAAVATEATALAVAVAVSMVVIGVTFAPRTRSVCDGKSSSEESGDLQPLKRSRSYEMLPPNLSELRVVLLGNSWSERSSVGNFILAECLHFNPFRSEEEPDFIERGGRLREKEVVLINTPDLLLPRRSNHSLREACRRLSDPGPHVFLLVLQPEDFTEEHKEKLCRFLTFYSDRSFDHSLVLISTPKDESPAFMERHLQRPAIKEMIEKCKSRFLWRQNLELAELLTRLDDVVRENNGAHV